MTAAPGPAGWTARVGQRLGVSDWHPVAQPRIDAFADCTGDPYWIHTDPVRARQESPTGTTIAHGFLTLSLLPAMAQQVLPGPEEARMVLNYGLDKVRFLAPVPAGARVRGVFTLRDVSEREPGEVTLTVAVAVEIEGQDRPALVADWLHRRYYDTKGQPA